MSETAIQSKHDEEDVATKKSEKPDGGYGWVILFAAFTISFVLDGCMYSFGILLDEIKTYYGVAQDVTNLVSSLNTGFLFLSG